METVVTIGAGSRHHRSGPGPRVGLFGLLASGNIGNDVSMEAMLTYLHAGHPDAVVDAMCPAPERMKSRYSIEATQMFCQPRTRRQAPMPAKAAALAIGKCVDAIRIAAWVRRHDVVIVPGTGILEATLPLRPWATPYAMFLLSASGRIFRTKVALVSIGASPSSQRATRWLQNWSARLAHYRSYRDSYSRNAMAKRRVDSSRDPVYPDLAFGVPVPPYDPGDERTIGVGVMQYSGSDDDRQRATEINATYVACLKQFAGWLVDSGHRVRLFVGDADDQPVADEILAYLWETRPGLDEAAAAADPVSSFAELTDAMQPTAAVVATRFHNVVCAVRLAKPTLSLSYGTKSAAIMADAGLAEFSLPTDPLEVGQLVERFKDLRTQSAELGPRMQESTAAKARLVDEQYARLAKELFPAV